MEQSVATRGKRRGGRNAVGMDVLKNSQSVYQKGRQSVVQRDEVQEAESVTERFEGKKKRG